MLNIEDCECIETQILGCTLNAVSEDYRDDLFGYTDIVEYRKHLIGLSNGVKAEYYQLILNKFNSTKDRFDWERVIEHAILKGVVEPLYGDPLDAKFLRICKLVNQLQIDKGKIYKTSWRKRGLVGVFHNLARKWDRIENFFTSFTKGEELDIDKMPKGDESIVETMADLFAYSGKSLAYMESHEYYMDDFDAWIKKNNLIDPGEGTE